MVATLSFLEESFDKFNKVIFNNELVKPALKIMNQKSKFGCLSYKRFRGDEETSYIENSVILSISEYYEDTKESIEDTIIHEMIHLYILQKRIKDTSDHGFIFCRKMNQINIMFGRHITITSDSSTLNLSKRNLNKVYYVVILKKDNNDNDKLVVIRVSKALYNKINNKSFRGYSIYRQFQTNNQIYDKMPNNSISSNKVKINEIPKDSLSKYI